jgi:MFS family permease
MQRITLDWYSLEITGSPKALGVLTAVQFLPSFIFSLLGGRLADKYNKAYILTLLTLLMGLLSFATGYLIYSGNLPYATLILVALIGGVITALDGPMRLSHITDLIGNGEVSKGVGLNSVNSNLGRLIGPLIAGFVAHSASNSFSVLFMVSSLFIISSILIWFFKKPIDIEIDVNSKTSPGTIRAGLSHLRSKPDSLIALVSVFIIAFFAMHFPTTIALMSREEFKIDIRYFGLLSSSIAFGYVFGGVLLARRNSSLTLENLMRNVLLFSVILSITSISPNVQVFAVLVFFCGVAGSNMVGSFNAYVQNNCDFVYRGRVLGVYLSCFTAGTTFGVLLVGYEAQVFGPRFPLYIGALIALILSIFVFRYKAMIRNYLELKNI